ncbi:MAG: DNA gyrase subunit B [Enterobacteriaceae bacterium PSpyr]|nr:MAG: DNA gyrase subunit B [Enterobacteriaceae bacterium PSpyr]
MYNNYNNIKILNGLEVVKKCPGMYIGSIDNGCGLHHMVFEIIDNSIDEFIINKGNKIIITIHNDNSISIQDNGEGIPINIHSIKKKPIAEILMTILHTGNKFNNNYNIKTGGLHGVGISVVNALSKKLKLIIYKNNIIYKQFYINGVSSNKFKIIKKTKKKGTVIRFWPNLIIFNYLISFNYYILLKYLHKLTFLNPKIKIFIRNLYNNKKDFLKHYGGINSYIKFLNKKKKIINKKIFKISVIIENINVDIVIQWNNKIYEKIYCFTNNIQQIDGGSHLNGFKKGIIEYFNNYIFKKKKIKNDDIKMGLFGIISIKLCNPIFTSQTKNKLISQKIEKIIKLITIKKFNTYLNKNKKDKKLIIKKIINSYKYRKNIIQLNKTSIKTKYNKINLINKLANCQEINPIFKELYLVEGDSAGGSAKQGRDRKIQAILPLKGKILNVEKANFNKIINSKEILFLMSAIGINIYKNKYNIDKIKYNKIIIMTDADVDGSHIRTLLLTFFYRKIPKIIEKGYIYIAQPPLYKIQNKKKKYYIKDNKNMNKYKINIAIKNTKLINKKKKIYFKKKMFKKIIYEYFIIKKEINNNKKYPYDLIINLIYYPLFIKFNNFNNYKIIKKWLFFLINKLNKKYKKNFIYYTVKIIKNININIFELLFCKHIYGNNVYYKINCFFFNNNKYKKILYLNKKLYLLFNKNTFIIKNKKKKKTYSFDNTLNWLFKNIDNKINIKRYKGLGEMNPEQLWESTMNPKNRNILNVYIKNVKYANKLFDILMGNNVKLRRNFIKNNSLNIININI